MIVRLNVEEIRDALGEAAIKKLGGTGAFTVFLESVETGDRDADGKITEVYANVRIERRYQK